MPLEPFRFSGVYLSETAASGSEKVLIATLIVTNLVTLAGVIIKAVIDQLNRTQDRLDRAQLARMTLDQLEAAKVAAGERERRIIDQVVQTKSVAIKAFREANGVNKKIKSLGMEIRDAATQQPIKGEIVSTAENPVQTEVD